MHFALIASQQDPAGITIYNALRRMFPFEQADAPLGGSQVFRFTKGRSLISLYLLKRGLLESDNLDKLIGADGFIFLSKHRSSSNTKSFAVHSIGNWATAEAGGKPAALCPAMALLQQGIFLQLLKRGREGYVVTMESTHHGPYMEKPSIFVEVGSTGEEWGDEENGRVISGAVMEAVSRYLNTHYDDNGQPNEDEKSNEHKKFNEQNNDADKRNEKPSVAIGIGGPHYCSSFNKLSQRKNIAFGHICPKHNLHVLDETMLMQALEKTHETVDVIILDWKGLGQEKQRISEITGKIGVPVERAAHLLKEKGGN